MNDWFTLVNRSMDIATGAPRVISQRLQMMGPLSFWSATSTAESQHMVLEKIAALSESWSILSQATYAPSLSPDALAQPWWCPQTHLWTQAIRTADKALTPLSSRVESNVKRLCPTH